MKEDRGTQRFNYVKYWRERGDMWHHMAEPRAGRR